MSIDRDFVYEFISYGTVVLSLLSVTLVYCGQIVGWIKNKLGMEVDLGPGHIALDADSAPPERGTAAPPSFRPTSIVAKRSPISATTELLLRHTGGETDRQSDMLIAILRTNRGGAK